MLNMRPSSNRLRLRAASVSSLLLALLFSGCSAAIGQFTWAADYLTQTPNAATGAFVVGVGDELGIRVFDNDKMSTRARVRSDGKIAMPLINDLAVAGKTPVQVAADVEKALRDQNLVINPRVTISVENVPEVRVTVIGAVARAGNLTLAPGSGVAEALAGAGGLTDYAHKDRIFVLRKLPTPVRIRFTFASLTDTGPASSFKLQQGDILVVE